MLNIRLYMYLEDETHDDNGYHIEKLYDRKCANRFYPNPMMTPKENVIYILRQMLDKLCEEIEVTIESESKCDLKFFFDQNRHPFMRQEMKEGEHDGA